MMLKSNQQVFHLVSVILYVRLIMSQVSLS